MATMIAAILATSLCKERIKLSERDSVSVHVVYEIRTRFGGDPGLDRAIEAIAQAHDASWYAQGSGEYQREISYDVLKDRAESFRSAVEAVLAATEGE